MIFSWAGSAMHRTSSSSVIFFLFLLSSHNRRINPAAVRGVRNCWKISRPRIYVYFWEHKCCVPAIFLSEFLCWPYVVVIKVLIVVTYSVANLAPLFVTSQLKGQLVYLYICESINAVFHQSFWVSFRVDLMSLVKRSLREFHLLAHLIFQRGQFFDSIQRHGRCFGEVKIYLRVIFEISQGMSLVGTLDVSASISNDDL